MKKILWQTRSPVVYESFCKNELLKSANGGNTYDIQAIKALSKGFDISLDKNSVMNPGENVFSYLKKIKNSNIKDADVIIREPYPVVFGKKNTIAKSVAIIHHIDEMQNKNSLKHKWFFKQLKKHLRKTDLVITVSDYWKNYLTSEGCKNVKVIYNSFNPDEYNINEKDVVNFKSKYDFKNNVPIIYIGNAHRKKGVYEVYNALKNSSYQLVMTGAKNNATDLPIKFLNLDRQDYLCLLHASGLVITFSNMEEGWNRIAHEAMLSKIPVIGSGTGGMKELLDKGKQKIVRDSRTLASVVEEVLKNKKTTGQDGFEYVKNFNISYFENEWINIVSQLVNE